MADSIRLTVEDSFNESSQSICSFNVTAGAVSSTERWQGSTPSKANALCFYVSSSRSASNDWTDFWQ